MLESNNIDINHLNSKQLPPGNAWLNIKNIESQQQCSKQYTDICQQHYQQKKWILVINPEKNALECLSDSTWLDTSKILQVNTNKVKVNLENIEKALSKGNCAAVILSNASLAQAELSHLADCARKGKTPCFILKSSHTLH
ncbi:SulA-like leucine-rich domain-containing protein [Thalassomonas sp. RHCl1]|uniref:SulA-like leucine-rich domain-containing protein n=1 Tax=Thalassomonas sp. RHCl1 TaxID=2995320 RepID=UPI00248C66C1|nr:SulA-like leucine-rich domain-containing protein [Thalassomonas sp. RHCl1]